MILSSFLWLWWANSAPRIALKEFRIEPTELALGESFTIKARAEAQGVRLGSFLLRTASDWRRDDPIPGFSLYANGRYYLAGDQRYFLLDNGKRDQDLRPGAFALEVSTQGWHEGTYPFAFFASTRPDPGRFLVSRQDFLVIVKGHRVMIQNLGPKESDPSPIAAFSVAPTVVTPGEPITLSLQTQGPIAGVQLTNPFFIAEWKTLPGFQYDPERKKSFYGGPPPFLIADGSEFDRDPAPGALRLMLDTNGWPPGVHHLALNVIGLSGQVCDSRHFAVKVPGPNERFEVTVESTSYFGPGTHFGRFLKLRDGTILCEHRRSTDGGRTWEGDTGGFGAGGVHLRDGRVLGLAYSSYPIEGREGWYQKERFLSTDGGRTFAKSQCEFYVPESKPAHGHAFHPGPLFMRSILEREDGSLVALMAGWFKSDTAICPYGRGRPYSRSYTCESRDGGQTWYYLSTIGYEEIGSEGYNEGCMVRLPDGRWLVVLRTGNATDAKCLDNPIMWSVSEDEGRTWSRPQRTGGEGAYPALAVMSDGTVVMSHGRPGAMLLFSTDGGRTWSDPNCVDATPYSGYTDVIEVEPGRLLVGFGTRGYLDPKTGTRSNQLRLAWVRVRRKSAAEGPNR